MLAAPSVEKSWQDATHTDDLRQVGLIMRIAALTQMVVDGSHHENCRGEEIGLYNLP